MSTATLEYLCDRGHSSIAPRLDRCPAFVRGAPCPGTLHAVGDGSQAENARLKATAAEATREEEPMPTSTTKRRAAHSVEVPLPRATDVAVATLEAALARVEGCKSIVRDGSLFVAPDEAAAIDAATRELARELVKEDRAANSYRDVLLREIRKAIAASGAT